ncbi:Rieske (2Fe-2S) protein [Pseudonocardia sp. T1-2H]|uniref:Rieske (2Fe-2S) protein n=1 Tax=Pseudonocardia sp. T1-2H TaxID=3128899 RepID=UPI0031010AC3
MTVLPDSEKKSARLPVDGEQDYAQSWYPICASDELAPGAIKGVDLMGGRVIAFRPASGGPAQVLSAYCPHLGADLSVGDVVGDTVRCVFHHWQYDTSGKCVATGCGDPVHPRARLFRFPTVEKFGFVWAFNGEEPLWDIPEFPFPEDELLSKKTVIATWPCDAWVFYCNTADIQHIKSLHGISFDREPQPDDIEWTDVNFLYDFKGKFRDGSAIEFRVGIWGTTYFFQDSYLNGRWYGCMFAGRPIGPNMSEHVMAVFTRASDGTPEENEKFLETIYQMESAIALDDDPVLKTIRFRSGLLTKSDRPLARYFKLLRSYPRANPARDHIT